MALGSLQANQSGQTLLVKTENGQLRLLHVGNQPGQPQPQTGAPNQTIRIQTVPSVSRFSGPSLAIRKTIVTQQPVKTKANLNIKTQAKVNYQFFSPFYTYLLLYIYIYKYTYVIFSSSYITYIFSIWYECFSLHCQIDMQIMIILLSYHWILAILPLYLFLLFVPIVTKKNRHREFNDKLIRESHEQKCPNQTTNHGR